VDEVDLGILRWMYPRGIRSYSGVDPRISTAEIAGHVGLTRKSVWARLREWRREGFWDGYDVRPNLAILGLETLRAEFRVRDAAEGWSLFGELERVEGVFAASLGFGDTASTPGTSWVLVHLAGDGPANLQRRLLRLRQIVPDGRLEGPWADHPPDPSGTLTTLDWRLIAAIVDDPNAPLSRIAVAVGATPRTTVRRRSAMIENHILFYRPRIDWSRHPSVGLHIFCNAPADLARVRKWLAVRFPHAFELSREGLGYIGEGYDPTTWVAVRVPARSPGEVQSLILELASVRGVRLIRPEIWVRTRYFPGWIRQRIAAQLALIEAKRLPGGRPPAHSAGRAGGPSRPARH